MNPKVLKLLRESAEWRLIALLFEPPADGWHEQVAQLAVEVDDATLKTAALTAGREATETLYHTTLGPGGPAAPREVSYQGRVLAGALLGELSGYYTAFAYDPKLPEAPDHVAVEAGFVAYLRLKEAFAVEGGQVEQAKVAADAARQFVDDHLNQIGEPLAKSLAASGIVYLGQAAVALHQRVGARREIVGLPELQEPGCADQGGCLWVEDASAQ
jgi:hypothetical protein